MFVFVILFVMDAETILLDTLFHHQVLGGTYVIGVKSDSK